jgi:hypothetical protein
LHQIYVEYGFSSSSPSSSSSRASSPDHDYYDADRMDLDNNDSESGGGERGRRRRRDEEDEQNRDRYNTIDALRAETQRGALEIATRMDDVLENAPYSTHAELLRLRGHVSLFIADLYLPSRLMERYNTDTTRNNKNNKGEGGGSGKSRSRSQSQSQGRISSLRDDTDRRLRTQADAPEEHVALARRREEQERAGAFFRRVLGAKGRLEDWILQFIDPEEERDEDDAGEEDERV